MEEQLGDNLGQQLDHLVFNFEIYFRLLTRGQCVQGRDVRLTAAKGTSVIAAISGSFIKIGRYFQMKRLTESMSSVHTLVHAAHSNAAGTCD